MNGLAAMVQTTGSASFFGHNAVGVMAMAEPAAGGLRGYGSMTQAGLNRMIYAGVAKGDPRVGVATDWLRRHHAFAENPCMGDAVDYHALHNAAKALDALGEETVRGADAATASVREEMADAILARQQPDGSWVNTNP